ncbi:MAG: hypothetical protein L0214_09110, partial [candidate division NC10 bacterium]|nr:hypothetical protein [candidate division NC10 bacterium]
MPGVIEGLAEDDHVEPLGGVPCVKIRDLKGRLPGSTPFPAPDRLRGHINAVIVFERESLEDLDQAAMAT